MATAKPPKGHFNVLYFASAGAFVGKESEALPAPLELRKLFAELEKRYPGVRERVLSACMVTVNLDYVDVAAAEGDEGEETRQVIREGDEVAIIPPVSSG